MLRRVQERVDAVCEGRPHQDQEPGHAGTEQARRRVSEERAEHEVRQQVRQVSVQRERGDDAPPLAAREEARVERAVRHPALVECIGYGRERHGDLHEGITDDAVHRVRVPWPHDGWLGGAAVLAQVGPELARGARVVFGQDPEARPGRGGAPLVGDADGGEQERAVGAVLGRHFGSQRNRRRRNHGKWNRWRSGVVFQDDAGSVGIN
jgi:hypothetical protein